MAVNTPDGGGGDTYAPAFTNINLIPADLAEFADLLDGDLKAISDTWERLTGDVAARPNPNFPGGYPGLVSYANGYPEVLHSGSGGIYEAVEFKRAYFRTVDAQWRLMADLIRGLETLREAARMIHDDYLASDAANASDLDGAYAAYELSAVVEVFSEPDQPAKAVGTDGPA